MNEVASRSPALSATDQKFLAEAADYLESPGFLMRTADLVGKPVEAVMRALPASAREIVAKATTDALRKGLDWAIWSLQDHRGSPPAKPASRAARFLHKHGHTALSAVTGAGGGFFGVAGLPIELPTTTMVMLRSIASIAAATGANLNDPVTRMECLAVLSFGSQPLAAMESSYFTTRLALAVTVRQAAAFVTQHTAREVSDALLRGTAPALVRLVSVVAARFQVTVTEKVAAQSIPVLGAALGALVNAAFTDHFNRVARYHFGIVQLERQHGAAVVQAAYEAARRGQQATRVVNLGVRPAQKPST
ncbi:MAG: EcsC family protein [Planctomycetaceae bacterium]|nr:EcsC family protein [Planctomycetaceae bacterium]